MPNSMRKFRIAIFKFSLLMPKIKRILMPEEAMRPGFILLECANNSDIIFSALN